MKRSKHGTREQKIFLALIREMREKAGLTQVELAKKLKMPQSFVSKYELGERRLDILEVRSIASVLGLSMVQFSKALDEQLQND